MPARVQTHTVVPPDIPPPSIVRAGPHNPPPTLNRKGGPPSPPAQTHNPPLISSFPRKRESTVQSSTELVTTSPVVPPDRHSGLSLRQSVTPDMRMFLRVVIPAEAGIHTPLISSSPVSLSPTPNRMGNPPVVAHGGGCQYQSKSYQKSRHPEPRCATACASGRRGCKSVPARRISPAGSYHRHPIPPPGGTTAIRACRSTKGMQLESGNQN